MLSIKLNHEFNYNTLLTIYNKLGLEDPIEYFNKTIKFHINSLQIDDIKIICVSNARGVGKTTLRTILAILAASNNYSVNYLVSSYTLLKDVELKIIEFCTRLNFDYCSIREKIKIILDIDKGINPSYLTIDDRR